MRIHSTTTTTHTLCRLSPCICRCCSAARLQPPLVPPVWREDDPYAEYSKAATKNWAAEETDTRFETESDMMELCDLAETL